MPHPSRNGAADPGQKDPLDPISYQILEILREDGRISVAALAERAGVSRATAYSRLDALQADGVILGFAPQVDPARVGLAIAAQVFVTVHPQSWPQFRELVIAMPEVEYCCVTTGEHDAMLLIRARDVTGVHEFVTGVIAALPQVRTVVSVVVLDEVVRRPYLLPADVPQRTEQERLGMTRWTPAGSGKAGMVSRRR